MELELKHIIRTQDFSRKWLEGVFFPEVEEIEKIIKEEKGPFLLRNILAGKTVLLVFWEPSARTKNRFYIAAQKLGAGIVSIQGIKIGEEWKLVYSSEMRDEIFEDTIRTFASQGADCIVIRHGIEGFVAKAAAVVDEFKYKVSVVNAGDGPGQHPTQALIDLYSIKKDFGKIDGLTGVLIGDLRASRVIHSLAYLLSKFKVKMYLVSPPSLRMPSHIIGHFNENSINYKEVSLEEVDKLKYTANFWYVVRIDERYEGDKEVQDYLRAHKLLIFDRKFSLEYLRVEDKVYHPFPRREEIPAWKADDEESQKNTLDKMPQAGYFSQIEIGVPVSMALLKMLLAPYTEIRNLWDAYLTDSITGQCAICGRIRSELGWSERGIKENPSFPKIICFHCVPKPEEK